MVILYSDLLEACGDDESARDMIIGHELGHIAARHLDFMWLILPGMFFPFVGTSYSRAREYTCDRYGAALAGDRVGMLRGLAILAAGGSYAKKVNLQSMVEQKNRMNTGWMTLAKWLMTHPPLCDRLAALEPSLAQQVPPLTAGPVRALLILVSAIVFFLGGISVLTIKLILPALKTSMDRAKQQAAQTNPAFPNFDLEFKKQQVDADFLQLAAVIGEHSRKSHALPKNQDELSAIWEKMRPGMEEPFDPFDGNLYVYTKENNNYCLRSSGPDGKPDTGDDIVYNGTLEDKKK